ncbi:hypothetical protein M885DRAFT_193497 [Pelagophyceae sp. CCMP2097]|nr:hypothetical protein M885DRAFT_193497 [Pelagophyceae sp. CCMP2097]
MGAGDEAVAPAKRGREAAPPRDSGSKRSKGDAPSGKPSGKPSSKPSAKQSTRRVLRDALALYARVGTSALGAVQRAQVLLKRVDQQCAAVALVLAAAQESDAFSAAHLRSGVGTAQSRHGLQLLLASKERAPTAAQLALRVDAQGRAVDAEGNVVAESERQRSLRANTKADELAALAKEKKKANPYAVYKAVDAADAVDVVDGRVKLKKRESKKSRAFDFVKEGHYVKIGEATRLRASGVKDALAADKRRGKIEEVAEASSDSEDEEMAEHVDKLFSADALPRRPAHTADVPGMEWWDEEFLDKEARGKRLTSITEKLADMYERCTLEHSRFAALIHHPAAVKPLVAEKTMPATAP